MKYKNEILNLKDMFENDEEFNEALKDAMVMEKLKQDTKFMFELEELEEKLNKLIPLKNKPIFGIIFSNYKRYLYKHIIELQNNKQI